MGGRGRFEEQQVPCPIIAASLRALRMNAEVNQVIFTHVALYHVWRERRGSLDVFSTPVVFVLLAREVS